MTIGGYTLATRAIILVAGIAALVLVVGFTVRSCDSHRSRAAQARVERSQSEAAANSAADAINAVSAAGEREAGSEALTRSNEQQIRNAQGANDHVNPAVRDAGIAALCRRQAYANDPRCKRP